VLFLSSSSKPAKILKKKMRIKTIPSKDAKHDKKKYVAINARCNA
jgi:hypothetical protein